MPSVQRVTVQVYTARLGDYLGADRVDCTHLGAIAHALAPRNDTWRWWMRGERRYDDWLGFIYTYSKEMRISLLHYPLVWDKILHTEGNVTLCCTCHQAARCHRTVLAQIIARLGAEPKGER